MKLILIVLVTLFSLNSFAQDARSEYLVQYTKGTFCDYAEMKMDKVANTVCLQKFVVCGKPTLQGCCWENRKGKFTYKEHVVFEYKFCPRETRK